MIWQNCYYTAWYTNQNIVASWENCISDQFGATNGVKQLGGVLSPINSFNTVYSVFWRIVCPLTELWDWMPPWTALCWRTRIRRWCNTHCSKFICDECNAEDLSITNYAKEYSVTFNPNKTLCFKFGSKRRNGEELFLDGTFIKMGVNSTSSREHDLQFRRTRYRRWPAQESSFQCCGKQAPRELCWVSF